MPSDKPADKHLLLGDELQMGDYVVMMIDLEKLGITEVGVYTYLGPTKVDKLKGVDPWPEWEKVDGHAFWNHKRQSIFRRQNSTTTLYKLLARMELEAGWGT